VSKETYQVSKETYQLSKGTYQLSKETCIPRHVTNSVKRDLSSVKRDLSSVKRDLYSKTYDKHLTARAQPAASVSLYAASGHHSFADPWAPGEGRREKEKRRVAARTKRSTYGVSK
jgi:hypothetical protein